ncbi:NitT/TauT family transport system substrate-binding protein [Thermanaeromonas toyohensis ToBE]|uniref:NitT/TauT family transport system substrate-binding protein n=1 Tax=Thermanaeromonas toyohensis ToBE TaxID=698762 RepID=A0A1W1W1B6_9FIRM|nr:ABC transporter substrate-binding protein [Thermanaeromonas toyohensis]SMB99313.1 NitT/TauT family transport system substrate-binding protein [Thermanaeromonas toyohensis ToBE]
MKKGFVLLTLLLSILIWSTSCSKKEVKDSSSSKIPTINFAYITSDHHTPLFIALSEWQKFRDKYDLYLQPVQEREWYDFYADGRKVARVKLISTKQGPDIQRLMAQGNVDIGITGVQALILSVDKGLGAKLISPLQTGGNLLIVKKELPANNWQEFVELVKGKKKQLKIGHPGAQTIASIIFRAALKEEGISFSDDVQDRKADIIFIDMKGHSNLAAAITNHIVDGLIGAEPFPTLAIHEGVAKKVTKLELLPPKGRWKNHACCAVEATDDIIAQHRDLVQKLEELLILATQETNQNRDRAAKVAANWLGVSEEVEREAIQSVNFTTEPSPDWRQSVSTFAQIMDEMGLLSGQLHNLPSDQLEHKILALDIYNAAAHKLRQQGFLK